MDPARLDRILGLLGEQLPSGAAITAILATLAFAVRGVSMSGAFWGWVLGTLLFTFSGWEGYLALVVFFVLGTAATRSGHARKATLGVAQEGGGRRGAKSVFANSAAGVAFAFLAVATPYREIFTIALVAAFATAAGDTAASEIGQAFGSRHYLVTTFRRVSPGTDGAVSLEGTLAGIFASGIVAAAVWVAGLIPASWVGIVVAAAFIGVTLESYLGATLERAKILDNDLVNFLNTVSGGLAAMVLWRLFPGA